MQMAMVSAYDKVDAAYIFAGLLDSYRAAVKNDDTAPAIESLIEHHSGECHLMRVMFETAISAAQALSTTVDFDAADLGMFAYEHLDSVEPGGLIYALWSACILEHKSPAAVVRSWANAMGWPTL